AAAKLSGLSGLVAGLAHEINTPLGALVSGADSAATIQRRIRERIEAAESLAGLRSDRGLDRALQALGSTSSASREAGARIHALVSALKSFAHLDRGEFEEVDLREGLESTMALIPAELLGDAKIIREYGDVPRVRCRVREVNQVFMTLVENALEAMGGQGELTLTVRKDHRDLCVEIQDTGPGISPEVQREIFDLRFHRDKKRVGMGLGLPVGRKVILEHGGDLEVRSRPGRGATFTVRIPGPEASLPLHSGMDTAARR
ncbi:MAG: HAMP domain-containing sensor histidine kinase, partial [Myxococcota bacterium]